ncbi:hypothetical protein Moror_8523 [Moniliophthora roreri MCA 2997]|nr:hypothetical protein Moror_8523 [Moniliophthora roreri MCA 2997]
MFALIDLLGDEDIVDITFLVPQPNNHGIELNKSLIVTSDASFAVLKNMVSKVMDIHPKNLILACRLSSQLTKDMSYHMVSNDADLVEIMSITRATIAATATSKAKNKKPFTVQVKNLNTSPTPPSTISKQSTGKAKQTKKTASKHF